MKAIFVSFNQAYYEMILNVMDRNNIRGFTYWNEVRPFPGDTSSDGSEDGSARITCFCLEHRKNNLIT